MDAILQADGYRVFDPGPRPDPAAQYKNCDTDDSGDPVYWGFEAVNGAWLVMKQNIVTKSIRYATGHENYASAWVNRASLDYGYPSQKRFY